MLVHVEINFRFSSLCDLEKILRDLVGNLESADHLEAFLEVVLNLIAMRVTHVRIVAITGALLIIVLLAVTDTVNAILVVVSEVEIST